MSGESLHEDHVSCLIFLILLSRSEASRSRSRRYSCSIFSISCGSTADSCLLAVQDLQLGDAGLVKRSRLRDRRLLRVGQLVFHDAGVGVLLLEPFHRELERALRCVVRHVFSVSGSRVQRTISRFSGSRTTLMSQRRPPSFLSATAIAFPSSDHAGQREVALQQTARIAPVGGARPRDPRRRRRRRCDSAPPATRTRPRRHTGATAARRARAGPACRGGRRSSAACRPCRGRRSSAARGWRRRTSASSSRPRS